MSSSSFVAPLLLPSCSAVSTNHSNPGLSRSAPSDKTFNVKCLIPERPQSANADGSCGANSPGAASATSERRTVSPSTPDNPQATSSRRPSRSLGQQQQQQQNSTCKACVSRTKSGSSHTQAANSQPSTAVTQLPSSRVLALNPGLPVAMQRDHWSLSDYTLVRKLSSCSTSAVYQALCHHSAQAVALKVYRMDRLPALNCHQVHREVRLHAAQQHDNIIRLHGAFQEGCHLVLVQEYAEGGDLYSFLRKYSELMTERRAVQLLRPLMQALASLHDSGIIHRDIKLENVLLTKDRVVKLADFGLAINMSEERPVTRAGTTEYMSPEVLRCPPKMFPEENKGRAHLHYGAAADVWSLGVLVYELVVGLSPFAGNTVQQTALNITCTRPAFPDRMSEGCRAFITKALSSLPRERPSVEELLDSAWIQAYPAKMRRTYSRYSETNNVSSLISTLQLSTARSLPTKISLQPSFSAHI